MLLKKQLLQEAPSLEHIKNFNKNPSTFLVTSQNPFLTLSVKHYHKRFIKFRSVYDKSPLTESGFLMFQWHLKACLSKLAGCSSIC